MLSYRHAFHAGNHADVLKHAILSRIVLNLIQKEKPFSYIDTHSGAGLYALDADWAKKTEEADDGIMRILNRSDIPALFLPYIEICRDLFADGHHYPGSPEIVRALSRADDQITLMELHPSEIVLLRENFSGDPRIHIHHRDGYSGLVSLCPPEPRRGFTLIDPSYETADDYIKTADTMLLAHRRWPVGILVLWYPILGRRMGEIRSMKDRLYTSEIQGILCAELMIDEMNTEIAKDDDEQSTGYGLSGSGMIIIQPPWKLAEELTEMLPYLAQVLGREGKGSWNVEWLTKEI